MLQLINVKCVPILIYGLEDCPLVKSDLSSMDFVINRFFYETMTNNINVVKCCQYYFGFDLLSAI